MFKSYQVLRSTFLRMLAIILTSIPICLGISHAENQTFDVGIGLLGSSGYHDALENYFDSRDLDSNALWVNADIGVSWRMGELQDVAARLHLMGNFIKNSSGSSRYANIMLLPAVVYKRYYHQRVSSPYASIEAAAVSASSDFDDLTFDATGIGLTLSLGYRWDKDYEINVTS